MVFETRGPGSDISSIFGVGRASRPRGPESDDLLTREQVAATLTAAGYRVREKTLATKASRGGGPPYQLFNRRALYRWGDALAWAKSEMRSPEPAPPVV
jgi:hypothetical protein